MALTITEWLRAVNPNIGLVVNPDGSYRIGVEDINSDEALIALQAILVAIAAGGPTTIADGADVTQGAIADAVVAAGAVGTLSAKLRRLTTDLAAVLAAVVAGGVGVYTTPTHTWPTIGAGTTVALAANANRLYAAFVNDGTEAIYLYLGAAAVMNRGIRLNAAGGSYEMSREIGNLYVGAVNGICASGGMILVVTEGV